MGGSDPPYGGGYGLFLPCHCLRLAHNPHKSRLVGQCKPFASHLELVKYYKGEAEKLRAAWKRQYTRKFTSGWKVDNFDAKAAVLKIATQKGDSWTESTLSTRLDIERCAESFSFREWGVERASQVKKAPPIKEGGCPDCVWDEKEQRYRGLCEKPRPTPPRPTKKKPPPVKDWGPKAFPPAKKAPPIKEGGCPHCYWDEESKQYRRKCCR